MPDDESLRPLDPYGTLVQPGTCFSCFPCGLTSSNRVLGPVTMQALTGTLTATLERTLIVTRSPRTLAGTHEG